MSDLAAKVSKAVAEALQPGEDVIAATKAFPEGGVKALAVRTAMFGVVGGAIGAAISQKTDNGVAPAGRNGFAVGVTDRRVLVCSLSALTGAPKKLLAELPLHRVRAVERGQTKAMAMKMTTFALALSDGTTQSFEVPKVSTKDADRVIAAIRERIGPVGSTA